MSKKNQNAVVEETVATEQNVVVEKQVVTEQNAVVDEQVAEIIAELTPFDILNNYKKEEEDIKAQINRLIAPLKERLELVKLQAKKFEEEHAEEIAAIRAARIKEALANKTEKKVNKSEIIRNLILEGKTKDQIKEATGFDNKTVLDITWRIEKELGLR